MRVVTHRGALAFAILSVALAATPSTLCAEEPPAGPALPVKSAQKVQAALDLVERHAVIVGLKFQKDLDAEEHGAIAPDDDSTTEAFRRWRMSWVVPGFVVKDRRSVLISDVFLPPGSIASVEVRTLDGKSFPARLRGFLRRAEGVVVETQTDLPVEPVAFAAPPEGAAAAEGLLAGSVAEGARGLEVWIDGLGTTHRVVGQPALGFGAPDAPTAGITPDEGSRTVDLVLGPGPKAYGLRFGAHLHLTDGVWRGADLLADAEVPLGPRRQRARIEVILRTTKRDDRDGMSYGEDDDNKLEFWGHAVGPDRLVVVGRLEQDQVRRIESIKHKIDESPGAPAEYLGKVKGLDAFVVRVPGAAFEALEAPDCPMPKPGEALLVHTTSWRGGARRDQLDYNRMLGFGRRYADRPHLATEREVSEGALLLDVEGRALGFAARLDPEDKQDVLEDRHGGRRQRPRWPLMAVLFRDVGGVAAMAAEPDTRVMPQEETESKRLPWLGVEAQGIDKAVAEMLEISAATRDGARGLLVGRVYAGSPAAKAGIQNGDILLTAKRTSGPSSDAPPLDLSERDDRPRWMNPWALWEDGEDVAPAPWRSQDTALHRLLKAWGEGTTFEVTYLRGKEQRTAALAVEIAPASYESAPRARDEATGITARDLTYEVRGALRLAADAPGVVIARVEPGSPAAQARIAKNEVLEEVEGTPVADAASLVALLEAARAQNKESVRCVVRRLDRTRLVEVQLAP
jgi:hypothetical protein